MPAGTRTYNQRFRPERSMRSIFPVCSTWPDTQCPPTRSPMRSARSRFTGEPVFSAPRVVTRRVSGPTSNCSVGPRFSATVRQTPSMLMLSPRRIWRNGVRIPRRLPSYFTIFPIASTMPVNIRSALHGAADADVGSDGVDLQHLDCPGIGHLGHAGALDRGLGVDSADDLRRDEPDRL